MLQLNSIDIKNYIIYDRATLHLDPGVTVIRGKNLDRKSKKASNGAGKSLVPGVVPGIFYDATPLPMKAKKNPREGFIKDTELNLKVTDRFNNKFTIKKFFKGSVKLDLIKNDRALKFRKKDDARKRMLKLMPLNEDQFYSLVYLDTKRSPVFQYGTDAQRHHFIESLYKLNIHDQLGEQVKKDWDKNREFIQELELLDRQLSQKIDENPGNPEQLKKQQDDLIAKVAVLRERVTNLLQKLQECRTYETLTKDLDLSKDTATLKILLSKAKKDLKSVKLELKQAQEHNQEYEAFKAVRDKRIELKNSLDKLSDVVIDKAVQDQLRQDRTLLNEIAEIEANNKEARAELEKLESKKFKLSNKHKKQARESNTEALKKALVQERTKVKEIEASIEDTQSHLKGDHKNCPVCNSLLSKNVIKTLLAERNEAVSRLNIKITKIKEMIDYLTTMERITELKNVIKPVESFEEVEKRIDRNEALVQSMRRKILLNSSLKELPKLSKIELVPTITLEKNYNALEEQTSELTRQLDKHENLDRLELPFKSIKQARLKRKEYEAKLEQYSPLLDKLQARSHIVGNNLSKSEVLVKDIEILSKFVKSLKLKTSNHRMLTALRKAFGARGIRRQRVAQIATAIELSLNSYAKMLFDFPIKFQLVVTDTKFQILATRNGKISDVRSLSGAESRYFSLLCLVALLPFCPNSMRVDTVIMDEIESCMDESFRQRLSSIFIPELLKIIPKIIIITPLSEKEFYIPKSYNYFVTKKNGKSILKKV